MFGATSVFKIGVKQTMFQTEIISIELIDLFILLAFLLFFSIISTVMFMYVLNVLNNNRRNRDLDKKITDYLDLLSDVFKSFKQEPLRGTIVDLRDLDKQVKDKQTSNSKKEEK